LRRGENDEDGTVRRSVTKLADVATLLDSVGEELLAGDAVELAERVNVRLCDDD
jgi:hypothetical protein